MKKPADSRDSTARETTLQEMSEEMQRRWDEFQRRHAAPRENERVEQGSNWLEMLDRESESGSTGSRGRRRRARPEKS